jgi:hypothetical protein
MNKLAFLPLFAASVILSGVSTPEASAANYSIYATVDVDMLGEAGVLNGWDSRDLSMVRIWAGGVNPEPVAQGSTDPSGRLELTGTFDSPMDSAKVTVQILHYAPSSGQGRRHLHSTESFRYRSGTEAAVVTLDPGESERIQVSSVSQPGRIVTHSAYQLRGAQAYYAGEGPQGSTRPVTTQQEFSDLLSSWKMPAIFLKIRRNH